MNMSLRVVICYSFMALLLVIVGTQQSWSVALTIMNMCIISAVMALGVNIQWGYAGLFNVGIMGFAALGGVAAVLASKAPVTQAWAAGGINLGLSIVALLFSIFVIYTVQIRVQNILLKRVITTGLIIGSYFFIRLFYVPAVEAIEAVNPAKTGYLGGMGLPIVFSWPLGGLLAAAAAWLVGKISLGLRSDYLAIATLGISEIVVAIIKNEDWLTRGVKNVTGLKRPVPYELNLQSSEWFIHLVERFHNVQLAAAGTQARSELLNQMVIDAASICVKLAYMSLFLLVLLVVFILTQRAQRSPWGRMMRAIRDNEHASQAMGKDVTRRHLQVFIIGSAVVGMAGAMMTTLDGQLTPGTYNPLRYTFLIWVMVIVGGSGNNLGSILGGFLIWFFWVQAEPLGLWLVNMATSGLADDSALRLHLLKGAPHMRLMFMGFVLLAVLRFSPRGLLPEVTRR